MTSSERIRYAVAGLGWFAQTAVLPAFAHAERNSELVALFSGDPKKRHELGQRYGIDQTHGYDRFEQVLADGGIDAVYVTLPNHLHREFTEKAAAAGVHVLCEKPMAVTEKGCRAMIEAAERHDVRLMIAYRLHFEEANLKAVEIVESGRLGEPRVFTASFGNRVTNPDDIRLNPIGWGGGTLYDIGIYCINAARMIFRDEPTEVTALSTNGSGRFADCDEATGGVLRFPGGRVATFVSSFGAGDVDSYSVLGTEGTLRVEPAFEFHTEMAHYLSTGSGTEVTRFEPRDQVAPEILYFSDCIRDGRTPEPSGREGLADVRIIRALYRSADQGRSVELEPYEKSDRPDLDQEEHLPPVGEQELVATEAPSD
jgi:glucose-fructose oxidoreductase